MFKKPIKTAAQNQLSGKDRKSIRNKLATIFDQESVDKLFSTNEKIICTKISGSKMQIYIGEEYPLLVDGTGKDDYFPSIYTCAAYQPMLKFLTLNQGVQSYIFNGANLMWPGVNDYSFLGNFKKDDVVAIRCSKGECIAIGAMGCSSEDIKKNAGVEGVAVHILHYRGDKLWDMGNKAYPQVIVKAKIDKKQQAVKVEIKQQPIEKKVETKTEKIQQKQKGKTKGKKEEKKQKQVDVKPQKKVEKVQSEKQSSDDEANFMNLVHGSKPQKTQIKMQKKKVNFDDQEDDNKQKNKKKQTKKGGKKNQSQDEEQASVPVTKVDQKAKGKKKQQSEQEQEKEKPKDTKNKKNQKKVEQKAEQSDEQQKPKGKKSDHKKQAKQESEEEQKPKTRKGQKKKEVKEDSDGQQKHKGKKVDKKKQVKQDSDEEKPNKNNKKNKKQDKKKPVEDEQQENGQQKPQKKEDQQGENQQGAISSVNSQFMDEHLKEAFLNVLKLSKVEGQLPIDSGRFFTDYMILARAEGVKLEVKDSSYKKLGKFYEEMAKKKFIEFKPAKEKKGQQGSTITKINWENQELKNYVPTIKKMGQKEVEEKLEDVSKHKLKLSKTLQIEYVYRLNDELKKLLLKKQVNFTPQMMDEETGPADKQKQVKEVYFSEKQLKQKIEKYINQIAKKEKKEENKEDKKQKTVMIDYKQNEFIHNLLKKQIQQYEQNLAKEEMMNNPDSDEEEKKKKKDKHRKNLFRIDRQLLVNKIMKLAISHYQMIDKETGVNKFKEGVFKGIQLIAEKVINKNVTKIIGLEQFAPPTVKQDELVKQIHNFAQTMQVKFASSATVQNLPGKNAGKQILMQGNFIDQLETLFTNQYGIKKEHITLQNKLGKKKKN